MMVTQSAARKMFDSIYIRFSSKIATIDEAIEE